MLHRLGALLSRRGVHAAASWCYREALGFAPSQADLLFELAKSDWQMGKTDAARQPLRQALQIDPQHAKAINLSGLIALSEGRNETAETLFADAVRLAPKWAAPCNNLGNVFLDRDDFVSAETWYRRALTIDPDYAEVLCNLGLVMNRTGRYAAAAELCRKAIRIKPEFAVAVNILGSILINLGNIPEGIKCYQEALQIDPSLAEAHINLALSLGERSHLIGAIDHFRQQLERNPSSYIALLRLAQAHQARLEYDTAEDYARRAVAVKPESPEAYSMLGELLMISGCHEEAEASFKSALDNAAGVGTHSSFIFHLHYCTASSSEDIALLAREWAIKYAEGPLQRSQASPYSASVKQQRPLKIGYISKDFNRHPVARFLEPLLTHHDRQRFKIYCYANLFKPDDVTEQLKKQADAWRDISLMPDTDLVKRIRDDKIDILIDLSGHTTGHRLLALAHKPAPVQVTYLGYPGTTGLKAIDYRIVDAITDPVGSEAGYATETLLRLPGCFISYQPSPDAPPVVPPPCLQTAYVTFGCFNNIAKVNRAVIAAWARILKLTPNSKLLLKAFSLNGERVKQRYLESFEAHGIEASRVVLHGWHVAESMHLDLYGQVDIALDPFPYNGTTTTCEALWMGVPVICLEGKRHSGRVGASLLNATGLTEMLASDVDGYVGKAVELAHAPDRLNSLRQGMRERMKRSPLLDHVRHTQALENTYEEIWHAHGKQDTNTIAEIEMPLADIARILLPDSLEVITRYVLEEQGDWFEAEMPFVRNFLQPGMKVIDVGANYGVYALSCSAIVGTSGAVWAFEPSLSVAGQLKRSAAHNGFTNLSVLERAVSNSSGVANFAEAGNSELSCLVEESAGGLNPEQVVHVPVTTLDHCREEFSWDGIDFIKIDAEGQEPLVVRGARQLLMSDAPLVMAEFKHGVEINTTMTEEFRAIGFNPYRLVRGPMVLIPFSVEEPIDPFLLNLFFCSRARASLLAERGLLVDDDIAESGDLALTYEKILHLHRSSLRQDLTGKERLCALKQALAGMQALITTSSSLPARLSLARLLFDYGHQDNAHTVYAQILKLLRRETIDMGNEAFLSPAGPFESIDRGKNLQQWVIAAVAEWLASHSAFSSYFSPADAIRYLRIVRNTGYLSEEVDRRIGLVLSR